MTGFLGFPTVTSAAYISQWSLGRESTQARIYFSQPFQSLRGGVSTATFPNPQHVSVDGAGESTLTRIQSIDIFRGITLAVMIFVNDFDGTKGLPWWTFHAKARWDVMTYVDMVFPVFLFLVGMSLPIAIKARLRKNPSHLSLWTHVFMRLLRW